MSRGGLAVRVRSDLVSDGPLAWPDPNARAAIRTTQAKLMVLALCHHDDHVPGDRPSPKLGPTTKGNGRDPASQTGTPP